MDQYKMQLFFFFLTIKMNKKNIYNEKNKK